MIFTAKKYSYPDMVTLAFKTSPFYSTVFLVQAIVTAAVPTLNIFATAYFLDTAINVVGSGAAGEKLVIPISLLILIMVHNFLAKKVMGFVNLKAAQHFRNRISVEILRKRAYLKYYYMEDSATLDKLSRVCADPSGQTLGMYNNVLALVQSLCSALGIIVTLITQLWYVGLIFIALFIPVVLIAYKAGQSTYKGNAELSEIYRRAGAQSWVIRSREATEERTVFGYGDTLNRRHSDLFEYARKFALKIDGGNFLRRKIGGIGCMIVAIVTMCMLLPQVSAGTMAVGMFIALFSATLNLSGSYSGRFNNAIVEIIKQREYLRELTDFMRLDEDEGADALPDHTICFNEIQFDGVSFAYPGTERMILNNISFIIESGRHYSFVGANGAGKTTIIKILSGLYDNYTGNIYIDGVNLREIDPAKRKGLAALVYQDFARYYITLRENIMLGNINKIDKNIDISNVIENVGLKNALKKLPDGINSALGKIFEDGVDLSGGEWQRIAMARAIVNTAPLIILDEPTAALDPLSECRLYEQFGDISRDKTTIFISHRLGSTKLADVIYVISDGRIAEFGDHNTLMKNGGLYSEMFSAQSAWYANQGVMEGAANG